MRCEIQECGNYQPCRIFAENTLAVQITMKAVKTQAAIFKAKFGVNQHDKVLRKKQSFKTEKNIPNKAIKEEYSPLHQKNEFVFQKHVISRN